MIHIFYIHYNIEKTDGRNRPEWFDFEKCFQNLICTIDNRKDISLHVMMDGGVNNNFISKYKHRFTLHEFKGGSNYKAVQEVYKYAFNLAQSLSDNDIFYFLENDYLHQKDWIDKVLSLYKTYTGVSYISLYDHFDKYRHPMYQSLVSRILATDNHHWRSTPSTCGSFLVPKNIFLEDFDTHLNLEGDHNKWIHLGQHNRPLLTPIPGLSTHCANNFLSPTINWSKI